MRTVVFAIRRLALYLLIGIILLLPFPLYALETGTVTEDFGSTSRREERNASAFWDTRGREVTLPLQYTVRNLGLGLKDLGGAVMAVAVEGESLLIKGPRANVIYRVNPEGTAENISDRGVTMPTVPTPGVSFSSVATRFSRIASRVRQNALTVEAGGFTYAAGPGLFVSLRDGLELTSGRIPELKDVDVRVLMARRDRGILIGGSRGSTPILYELALQGFAPSAALETKQLASTASDRYFKKATLEVTADLPEGTAAEYTLSPDGGVHWETVIPNVAHTFQNKGTDLRLRMVLTTNNSERTPAVQKVVIQHVRAEVETPQKARERDNRRVSDLQDLARRLEKFKRERGVYPIVDDQYARVRWSQLGQLLKDGKFIDKLPQDPKHDEDPDRLYDYLSTKAGHAYVLRALLEEAGSKKLEKDVEGKPVEAAAYDYSCDDPWYCEGQGFTVAQMPAQFPEPTGTAPLLRSEDGRVFRVAITGGGTVPTVQRKLYIPKPVVISQLKNFYTRMQTVGRAEIQQYPRVRLVKLPDKDDIYYLTETWLKRRLPSKTVFDAYGNDLREVVVVQPQELEAYGESRLIRLVGDRRVWYLEGGVRRLVRSPEIMTKRGFNFKLVAPVNFAEYNSYPEGVPLE